MKLLQASLLGLALSAPVWAQRSAPAGRAGGGSSHPGMPAPAPRLSSPAIGPPRSFNSAPAYRANATMPERSLYNSPIGAPPFGGTQANGGQTRRYPYPEHRNRPYYANGLYFAPGWIGGGYYGYGYSYTDEPAPSEPQNPSAGPDTYSQPASQSSDNGSPIDYDQAAAGIPPRPPYDPESAPAPDLPEQPQLTLFFKDGRPPQKVGNYAVTRTTLYIYDGARRRELSVDLLDLPQTEKVNREAGVDFNVPEIAD